MNRNVFHYIRLHKALSNLILNVPRDGASPTSLGCFVLLKFSILTLLFIWSISLKLVIDFWKLLTDIVITWTYLHSLGGSVDVFRCPLGVFTSVGMKSLVISTVDSGVRTDTQTRNEAMDRFQVGSQNVILKQNPVRYCVM